MEKLSLDEMVNRAIEQGVIKGVSEKLGGYGSPLEKMICEVLDKRRNDIKKLVDDGISLALAQENFQETIHSSIRKKLGDILVQRFGGELEKQVNALKSDPSTRARITVAIDDIIKTTAKA